MLQREKKLYIHTVCFGQNLTPTVLAGGLSSQNDQIVGRELQIVIAFGIWEKKVGLFVVLGDGLLLKYLPVPCVKVSWHILERFKIFVVFSMYAYFCNHYG